LEKLTFHIFAIVSLVYVATYAWFWSEGLHMASA